jgi:hypothetical protein
MDDDWTGVTGMGRKAARLPQAGVPQYAFACFSCTTLAWHSIEYGHATPCPFLGREDATSDS